MVARAVGIALYFRRCVASALRCAHHSTPFDREAQQQCHRLGMNVTLEEKFMHGPLVRYAVTITLSDSPSELLHGP